MRVPCHQKTSNVSHKDVMKLMLQLRKWKNCNACRHYMTGSWLWSCCIINKQWWVEFGQTPRIQYGDPFFSVELLEPIKHEQ